MAKTLVRTTLKWGAQGSVAQRIPRDTHTILNIMWRHHNSNRLSFEKVELTLAAQACNRHEFKLIQSAAMAFDVPAKTLKRRLDGYCLSPKRLLEPNEEDSLVDWILAIDKRGMPFRLSTARLMAYILPTQRVETPYMGINWPCTFVAERKELKSKYNRKYDYQRATCEDPELIRAWFDRVKLQ